MARQARELTGLLDRTRERVRKKKIVGQGKDSSARRGGEGLVGTAGNLVDSGPGARQAAAGRKKELERENMRSRVAERKEIMRDPERTAEQKKINRQALQSMKQEVNMNRMGHMAPDRGSLMDYAADYVPMDDEVGKEARKEKNRAVARRMIKRK